MDYRARCVAAPPPASEPHMPRSLALLLAAALPPSLPAQEIPGLRASLFARSLVPATTNVELRLVLQVDADLELPAALLSGVDLTVKCDDATVPFPAQPGKPGTVSLAAGTVIERTLRFPASAFVAGAAPNRVANVSVAVVGLPAAACAFKVAPDVSNLDVSTLDLAKTEVVLVTNFGDMRVSFRPDKAPKTVAAFVDLCRRGFYDGTKFYRVVRDFMIQGGCPLSKDDSQQDAWGGGTSGVRLKAEWSDLRHLRGTLAMARGDHPDSADCHFFLVHKDSPHLDGRYTAFGNLEAGADVLDRIAETAVGGPKRETPLRHVILHAAIVLPVKK
jgi:peptidyl-prolyl cis-trans isomerase B (cyclophilin B)